MELELDAIVIPNAVCITVLYSFSIIIVSYCIIFAYLASLYYCMSSNDIPSTTTCTIFFGSFQLTASQRSNIFASPWSNLYTITYASRFIWYSFTSSYLISIGIIFTFVSTSYFCARFLPDSVHILTICIYVITSSFE
jgi:hypothetical protein